MVRAVTCLSLQSGRSELGLRLLLVGCKANRVALGQVFLPILRLSPAVTIAPIFPKHSVTLQLRRLTATTNIVVK